MLTIRLQRVGRKNDPSFRVVVTDSKNGPKSGKFLEILGSYNARFGKPQLNADRINHWLAMGAKTSLTVRNMLVHYGVIKGEKVNNLPKKKEVEKPAEAEAPKTPEAPAPEGEAPAEISTEETPTEEAPVTPETKEETTPTETKEEVVEEKPAEETTPEAPVETESPAEPTEEKAE